MQVYSTNQTAGANVSLSITRYDYGEYICTASNEFGRTTRSVEVQHPGMYDVAMTYNKLDSTRDRFIWTSVAYA